jgi:hypothetical protein
MLIELQLTKIGAVERISLKAHGLHSVANSSASPTVAYASGSVFRVFPCFSVANSSASPTVAYASGSDFRVIPWQKCLFFVFFSVALLLLRTYQ